jgi:hypothetical protein
MLPQKSENHEIYDNILQEFARSGARYAEVRNIGRKPETVFIMLKSRMRKLEISDIDIKIRNKQVYLERTDSKQTTLSESGVHTDFMRDTRTRKIVSTEGKPSVDVITLQEGIIIMVRCPNCNSLNAKDLQYCRDCGTSFYKSESEYRKSIKSMERLEGELNKARK